MKLINSFRALRTRRALIGLGVGAAALLGAAGASADSFAGSATPYQNSTIAAALANNPSGTRIAPAVVSWENGDAQMVVPSTANGSTATLPSSATDGATSATTSAVLATPAGSRSSCPSGTFTHWACVYNQTNYNGTMLEFKDTGYYQNLYSYGGTNWVTLSWVNTTGGRAWLNQNENHSNPGAELCMTPGGAGTNSFGSWSGDQWFYLDTNSAQC